MTIFFDYLSIACLCFGSFFILTSAFGIWKMPDFFTRLHPAGVADSMGAPLILIGIAIKLGVSLVAFKIILLMIFALYTSATACHALSKAALLTRKPLAKVEAKGRK